VLRTVFKFLAIALAAALLVVAGYVYWVGTARLHPGDDTYVVAPGTSLRAFNRQLHEQGVLPDSYSLVWLARIQGHSRALKAGEYHFRPDITPLALLDQVVAGRVVEYPLVIIEGWTFKQVVQTLAAAPKLKQTLGGLSDAQIMARLGHAGVHPEGRFFPDTYYYSKDMTDAQILRRAYAKMEEYLQGEWEARDRSVPLKSPDEALILASIVEKETGQADERPQIAGVFVNRLRKRIKLQTDPTVIYGMGAEYRGNIRLQDLRRKTPYNTYVIYGLPPTPIAMPGAAAIRAALKPASTNAIYFVSRGDGSHVFSEHLHDHNAAVVKYQLNGRGKTPVIVVKPPAKARRAQ
jgi:UPF0755 protein